MPRHTRLFRWGDQLIAAYSPTGATELIRDRYGTVKGNEIKPLDGWVEYCDSEGQPAGRVSGDDCSRVWPKPCLISDDV